MRVAALFGAVGVVAQHSPVEKVTQLLEQLQVKVVTEGKQEATTYDAFACFCKDTSKKKSEAIAANDATIESLQGKLETQESNRDKADEKIGEKQTELNDLAKALALLQDTHKSDKSHYATEIEDIEAAVDSLERAIATLKASDKDENAFVQVKSTVQTAVLLADTLGMLHKKNRRVLLQAVQPGVGEEGRGIDVAVSDYDFHSHGIIKTLEDLLIDFRKTRDRVNDAETKRVQQYTTDKQANHDQTLAAEKSLADAQKAKAMARDKIGSLMGDLSLTKAALDDDRSYLVDLTDKCNAKKKMWDQRSAMRQDELTALTQAIGIIKGGVADNTTKQTIRFTQESASFVQIREVSQKKHSLKKISSRRSFMQARSPREQVMELLRSKSQQLKSAALASLASRVAADPLAKVKKLIEELVLRLQEEAKNEESHNGWCVKQTNLAEQKRTREAGKTTDANSALAELETKRDKVIETIERLTSEIAELDRIHKETKQIYDDETAERDNAIKDAKAGQTAVTDAVGVLKKFYAERASKPEKALLQQPKADDIPDAGFDEEYFGAQDTATGIFGMLEVITSDFVRTIEESEAAQEEADKEFFEFEKETTRSREEKSILKEDFTRQKTETLANIQTQKKELDRAMTALEASVTELLELHEACQGGGMTYEERVAKREEEIEALKDAFEILENYRA
jgi:chromosome segregation ATPase